MLETNLSTSLVLLTHFTLLNSPSSEAARVSSQLTWVGVEEGVHVTQPLSETGRLGLPCSLAGGAGAPADRWFVLGGLVTLVLT